MTATNHAKIFVAALLAIVGCSSNAFAWGDLGHKVICEIALRRVSSATRAEIDKLIQTDKEYNSFSDACAWPDHPRKRPSEHFLNLPRDSHGLIADDCAGAHACVVTAIRRDTAVLASKNATPADKLASLKYLGHWVGDAHQPLHVSFADDRGGNDIRITGECQSNLHSAWDTCLVISATGTDAGAAAKQLLAAITPDQTQIWIRSSPRDWANESFAVSESSTTRYCHFVGSSCEPDVSPLRIDRTYVEANAPIVREQLVKAGIRLAHLLDDAFEASSR
jgi:hypothetical protein